MSHSAALHAFAAYGIELEYMIVDRHSLDVRPLADRLLVQGSQPVNERLRGRLAWSNELVLHVLELKNLQPDANLEPLAVAFQQEVAAANRQLEPLGARLMPSGMHPWMNPQLETCLWPHGNAEIYQAYDRVFDCRKGHGWANLQSMHLNLPFSGDEEFARLHAAIRLLLPIIPALAASSPIMEGGAAGLLDYRMEAYRTNALRVPSSSGKVIPDNAGSRAEYQAQVLEPMYREIAAYDPAGVLRHEWLNSRGAIPRFSRNAIEIRVIDMQECPQADLAIAAAVGAAVRGLYESTATSLAEQQSMTTGRLAAILHACIHDAEQAIISDAAYLQLLGYPGQRGKARELWQHLIETTGLAGIWLAPLKLIMQQGTLARRILGAAGGNFSRAHLQGIYRQLCDCLATGTLFETNRG